MWSHQGHAVHASRCLNGKQTAQHVQPRYGGLAEPYVKVSHDTDAELLSFLEHSGCTGPIPCQGLNLQPALKALASLWSSWLPVAGPDWAAGSEQQRRYQGSTTWVPLPVPQDTGLVLALQQKTPWDCCCPWGREALQAAEPPIPKKQQ